MGHQCHRCRALNHHRRRKWLEIKILAEPSYQHLLLTAEKKFRRGVESGEPPALFWTEPRLPASKRVRTVDMRRPNAWAAAKLRYLSLVSTTSLPVTYAMEGLPSPAISQGRGEEDSPGSRS
jgi:hypothetical protein